MPADLTAIKCPGCSAGFTRKPFNRNGWYYSSCGRRWHPDHGWESFEPTGCLHRQVARLLAIVDNLPKTADGKPIVTRGTYWDRNGDAYFIEAIYLVDNVSYDPSNSSYSLQECVSSDGPGWRVYARLGGHTHRVQWWGLYTTPEAAEQAKESMT